MYFGLPSQICSDNGPPFNFTEFIQWGESNGIKILKSPLYHPQSNGLAERGVQTIKGILKKFLIDPRTRNMPTTEMLRKMLFSYNNTPSTVTSRSPTDLLFLYKPKTVLNSINPTTITKQSVSKSRVKFDLSRNKTYTIPAKTSVKVNLNKNVNYKQIPVKALKNGEKVWYQNSFKDFVKWIPGEIIKRISKYLYLVNIRGNFRTAHQNQLKVYHSHSPVYSPVTTAPILRNKSTRMRRPPNRLTY